MMKWFGNFCLLSVLVACGTSEEEVESERELGARPRVVGEVASVYPDKRFLLIKRYGPGDLPSGGVFSVRSANGLRNLALEPTGEKAGKFHAADFPAGEVVPRKGDLVVMTPTDTQEGNSGTEEIEKNQE